MWCWQMPGDPQAWRGSVAQAWLRCTLAWNHRLPSLCQSRSPWPRSWGWHGSGCSPMGWWSRFSVVPVSPFCWPEYQVLGGSERYALGEVFFIHNLRWEKCLPGLFQETLPRSTACETRLEANSLRAGPQAQSRSLGKRPETSCG